MGKCVIPFPMITRDINELGPLKIKETQIKEC